MNNDLISDIPKRLLSIRDLGYTGAEQPSAPVTPSPAATFQSKLLGLSPETFEQIEGALAAGKTHFMFYGPPGTGKTTLAKELANWLLARAGTTLTPELLTASGDWTSQDLIGGYQPTGAGKIAFRPGILLRNFDRPVIVDEFNRCDIDKVLGPLFSMLANTDTTLPYSVDPADVNGRNITVLAAQTGLTGPDTYSPSPNWRLLATINSSDKATLAVMSFALMRRFAWIFIGSPEDKSQFIAQWCADNGLPCTSSAPPLAAVWDSVCAVRPLGAAPFIDVMRFCAVRNNKIDFGTAPDDVDANNYANGLSIFVIPLLDGITKSEAQILQDAVTRALGSEPEDDWSVRLASRLQDVSV